MTTKVHQCSSFASAPLVPSALAVMVGIVADRFADPWTTATWAAIAVVAAALAASGARWRGVAVPALVVAFAALGGGWHHHQWSDLAADDLARGDWITPRPAWVRGVLVAVPEFRESDQAGDSGLTRTVLAVTAIRDGEVWRAVTGRVDVSVSGDRANLAMGDPVMAAGMLGEVAGPLNPGETDRRDSLRARGVRLRMAIGEPMSLWPDPQGTPWPWHQRLGTARSRSQERLVRGLDPAVAPLAAALLLGRREAVDPDVNDAFARTGTTHLLAISGLHLQVLAGALWMMFRTLGTGRKSALLGVVAATVAYAILVGGMPSVVRSVAMTVAICLAGMRDRRARGANLMAAAALATLVMNPAHLFDVGCQLSFLCVAAVFWGVPPAARRLGVEIPSGSFFIDTNNVDNLRPVDPLKALERRYESAWKRLGRRFGTWLALLLVTSAVVWLVTLPLVMLRFHLISPIGVLLNVPLIPITSLALLLACLTLLTAASGPFSMVISMACTGTLKLTGWMVRWGGSRTWGHQFVAGPTCTWAMIAYGLLALVVVTKSSWRCWAWGVLGGWLALGLISSMVPARPAGLEAEVFAVGHGLSVLIQGSDGRAILYDCGRMRDPHVGRRLIAPALWARGVHRLDAVILSHADADHYNGLPDLLERFPIGEVRVPPGFDRDPSAARALRAARIRGVQVRPIVAGDRVDIGPGATLAVLHPPEGWPLDAPDNAHSVVLDLASEGRRVLLTGDLEGVGQAALTGQPPRRLDALLAPHHGGRTANPPWFYRWA
ncbi:MAG: ComEC/Rec2 family competence protein, partial [Isosphaeraceae bacterium]